MTTAATRSLCAFGVLLLTELCGCGDSSTSPNATTPNAANTATRTPSAAHSATPSASATASSTPSTTPSPTGTPTLPRDPRRSGGETTVFNTTRNAFALPAANLDDERESTFFVGNALFNRSWVTAPASTEGSDGVGPVFNARSCSACHFHDGRGRPPQSPDDMDPSLLFRLSMPGLAANGGIVPDPVYGDQLQPQAILGVPPEGRATIRYFEEPITHADGSSETLRRPEYGIVDLAYGSLSDSIQVSPRVAPFLIGLGLLAAVDDASLLALADPADLDNDGISGRPNRVWDVQEQKTVIGRFGWKANQPTLAQQNAGAFLGDIGITSELFQEQNCTPIQAACQAAPNGGTPEIDAGKLAFITFYTHTLAVPARRNVDAPVVQKGEALFAGSGCSHCHLPELTTGELAGFPELSRQLIHPYTDLLLHDMGVGLADGRPDFEADGQEWRTPPLWGIGLVHTVNGHSMFLHDGRARNLAEAILWHGGEAAPSRDAYRQLSSSDRDALLRFLESL